MTSKTAVKRLIGVLFALVGLGVLAIGLASGTMPLTVVGVVFVVTTVVTGGIGCRERQRRAARARIYQRFGVSEPTTAMFAPGSPGDRRLPPDKSAVTGVSTATPRSLAGRDAACDTDGVATRSAPAPEGPPMQGGAVPPCWGAAPLADRTTEHEVVRL